MDESDRLRLDREVLNLIKTDIHVEFRTHYKRCHRITRELPLEPSNELRNVFDHLGRCLAESQLEEAERHLTNARAHAMLAVIDCLLQSVVSRMLFSEDVIVAFELDEISPHKRARQQLLDSILRDRSRARVIRDRIPQIGPVPMRLPSSSGQIPEPQSEDEPSGATANLGKLTDVCNRLGRLLTAYNRLYGRIRGSFALEELIRIHARGKWERAGKPSGRDLEFWCAAESHLK